MTNKIFYLAMPLHRSDYLMGFILGTDRHGHDQKMKGYPARLPDGTLSGTSRLCLKPLITLLKNGKLPEPVEGSVTLAIKCTTSSDEYGA
jgi:hypothetical protein